ncbi:hypothetical protein [Actinocorallia libanotica]|uniref:Uncharacterized protein n=1 Tax=Actinocorallia libanotica TaxID=46162 RepID=A0ABN1S000_9ACTN
MLNVTTFISKHTDRRAFDATSLRHNDPRDLLLRMTDPADRVLMAVGLCTLAIAMVNEPDGPLFWLTLLSGLVAPVACRFGTHEAITRRAIKGSR